MSRTLEGESNSTPQSLINTSDGGFLVVAVSAGSHTSANDIMLVKFSSSAAIEWLGLYGAAQSDFALAAS